MLGRENIKMMTEFKELSNWAVVMLYNQKYEEYFDGPSDVIRFEQDKLSKDGYYHDHDATTKDSRCLGYTEKMKRGDKVRLWTGVRRGEFNVTEVWVKAPLLPTLIKVEAKKQDVSLFDLLEEPHKGHKFLKAMEEYEL